MATQNVRQYGSNDLLTTSVGAMSLNSGDITVLCVVKTDTLTSGNRVFVDFGNTTSDGFALGLNGTNNVVVRIGASDKAITGMTIASTDGYVIVGFSRASGTTTPRAHLQLIPSGIWQHVDAPTTGADPALSAVSNFVGQNSANLRPTAMWFAALGVFNSNLSDLTIESLNSFQSWKSRMDNILLWRMGDNVVNDLSGNGANQISINGTSIVSDLEKATFDLTLSSDLISNISYPRPTLSPRSQSNSRQIIKH